MYNAKIIVTLKHDKGTVKISTFAPDIDSAISKVLEAEKAPKTAVKSAKVAPVTIYEIKYQTKETAPYFFTRQEMKFFRQKMTDFSVKRYGNDKFIIEAPRPYGKTVRIFNPFTRELEFLKNQTDNF